jgi:hypothetical protein
MEAEEQLNNEDNNCDDDNNKIFELVDLEDTSQQQTFNDADNLSIVSIYFFLNSTP